MTKLAVINLLKLHSNTETTKNYIIIRNVYFLQIAEKNV